MLIDWLLDWYLLYQDEEDYRRIFAETSFDPASIHFEYEPLRANLFVVAQRRWQLAEVEGMLRLLGESRGGKKTAILSQ